MSLNLVEISLRRTAVQSGLVALVGIAGIAAALAQEPGNRFGRKHHAAGAVPASLPECTCRAQGQSYHIGTETCLYINGISQIFRCDMDLNVTSWKPTGSLCPLS